MFITGYDSSICAKTSTATSPSSDSPSRLSSYISSQPSPTQPLSSSVLDYFSPTSWFSWSEAIVPLFLRSHRFAPLEAVFSSERKSLRPISCVAPYARSRDHCSSCVRLRDVAFVRLEETIPQGRLVLGLSVGYGSECTRDFSGEMQKMFVYDLLVSQEGQVQ